MKTLHSFLLRRLIVVLALLCCGRVSSAQSVDAQAIFQKSSTQLKQIVQEAQGVVGCCWIDLKTGRHFGINDTLSFPQASAIKVPILMEVFKQAFQGNLNLAARLTVTNPSKVGGSGILQYLGDGTATLSIRDLCILMISLSDNTATNMLIDLVGMEKVNQTLSSLGLADTKLQRTMMNPAASGRGRENISTPRDAARIMELLFKGTFIDPKTSSEVLSILKIPKPIPGDIGSVLPDSVEVAFKSGELSGVRTEWALVLLKERPYILVVMEGFEIRNEGAGVMRRISTIVFDYFWRLGRASRYGVYLEPELLK